MVKKSKTDHQAKDGFDNFLKEVWKDTCALPRIAGRPGLRLWNEVLRVCEVKDKDTAGLKCVKDAVVIALEDYIPGVSKVYKPHAAPLASVQRLVHAWDARSTVPTADKEDLPEMVRNVLVQRACSEAPDPDSADEAEVGATVDPGPAQPNHSVGEATGPAAPTPQPKVAPCPRPPAANGAVEDQVRDEEDEGDRGSDGQKCGGVSGAKITSRQLSLQLRALELDAKQRAFEKLPPSTCYIPESDLLNVEKWVRHDMGRLYDSLCKYFLGFNANKASTSLKAEIRNILKVNLPDVIEAVYRNVYNDEELGYAYRSADNLLKELDRRKIMGTHGYKVAKEIEHRVKVYDSSAPTWVKAREAVLAKGFRSPSLVDAAGEEGDQASL